MYKIVRILYRTFFHLMNGSGYPVGVHSTEPLPAVASVKRSTDTVILETSAGLGGEVGMTINVTARCTFDDKARQR